MQRLACQLLIALLASAAVGYASTANIGVISFDVLISGTPGAPGVNAFDISDLTGDPGAGGFALPPDFPVFTSLTFTLTGLALVGSGGTQNISLGSIVPGTLSPPPSLQFPDTTTFSSSTLVFTLSQTNLALSGGGTFAAASSQVTALLLPSSGNSLVAGTDFALITVSTVSPVPEPGSFTFVFAGLAAVLGWRKQEQR